jgi:hypothetical protein
MRLLVRRCLDRSHRLEEYVETWQIDHKEAMYACDLEELVSECLQLESLLRRAWSLTTERLFDEGVKSYHVFAGEEVVRAAISRTVRMFKIVSKLLEGAERAGYSIDGSGKFGDANRAMESLEKDVEADWSPMDSQQMRESISAFERGEVQSAEDLLCELQGDGAKTN